MASSVPLPSSPRLAFRLYLDSDEAAVRALFADDEARRFYPRFADDGAAARWIAWSRRNYERHGFGLWGLELKPEGGFVGDAGLTMQPVEGRELLEIGYHVHLDQRGKGLATEAAQACLRWAFAHTAHDLVCSIVDPRNHASIAVARRVHKAQRMFQGCREPRRLFYTERETRLL